MMTIPAETTLIDVVERVVEHIHLTSEHRANGEQARFFECPHDPCMTWRRFLASRLP